MNISHFFIDRPIFAAVISIIITLIGGVAYFALPVAQYPDIVPPTATRLSHLMSELSLLRAEVSSALTDFMAASEGGRERLSTMASILRFNNLKIAASEQAFQRPIIQRKIEELVAERGGGEQHVHDNDLVADGGQHAARFQLQQVGLAGPRP